MLKISDVVIDEDGFVGIVGIRYNDGDFCIVQNDAAHPNPRKCKKEDVTRFAGDESFRKMVQNALNFMEKEE